jgi:curved DNA-binding protein CbpA
MAFDSKFHDKIRIQKKAKPEEAPSAPACQWDGCTRHATHRAPAGRMREGEFFMFCVDHVRDYNKNYNYFSGLPDTEIAQFQKDALTGHRPTWQMASNGTVKASPTVTRMRSGRAGYYKRVGGGVSGDGATAASARVRTLKPLESKALRTLGLSDSSDGDAIRARYTELVKQHHPDANGGVRGSEERLQEVIQAYRMLKKAGHC